MYPFPTSTLLYKCSFRCGVTVRCECDGYFNQAHKSPDTFLHSSLSNLSRVQEL